MVVWGLLGQTNVEITKEADWEKLLQQEEALALAAQPLPALRGVLPPVLLPVQEEMRRVCDDILKVKPDLVITEKGVSAHCLRRLHNKSQLVACICHKDLAGTTLPHEGGYGRTVPCVPAEATQTGMRL